MTASVVTLTETTERTGYVLGVFSDFSMALDAARSNARRRIDRCNAADEKTFGGPNPPDTYAIVVNSDRSRADVFIAHRPSGDVDLVRWQLRTFEIIEPVALTEPQQPDLFPLAA
jgi:hypothetical protein